MENSEPTLRRLVVLSPHLDDAALSLGAAISYASRAGLPVTVLTGLVRDPDSDEAAGTWDSLCGFTTVGDAARARRIEDERACEILDAEPIWLPFVNGDHADARNDDEIWEAVEPQLAHAALVLIPGYPLEHADHAWLTRLVTKRASASTRLGLYVEQPYANLVTVGRGYRPGPLLAAASIALGPGRDARSNARHQPTRRPRPSAFRSNGTRHAPKAATAERRSTRSRCMRHRSGGSASVFWRVSGFTSGVGAVRELPFRRIDLGDIIEAVLSPNGTRGAWPRRRALSTLDPRHNLRLTYRSPSARRPS